MSIPFRLGARIPESELILNPDGSVYHLHLLPEQIAPTIITVGDPDRVDMVSRHFDHIEHRVQKREFITHTGRIGSRAVTVISTGIGTDNIDICLNELDALVNIDLHTRTVKEQHTALDIVRIGTSGCLHNDIPLGSFLASDYGLGLDGLMLYYEAPQHRRADALYDALWAYAREKKVRFPLPPTVAKGSEILLQRFASEQILHGITLTAPGFYAPQNRQLRVKSTMSDLLDMLVGFSYENLRITNFEMETAGIYGLCEILGHRALSLNVLIANREAGKFIADPYTAVDKLIKFSLDRLFG